MEVAREAPFSGPWAGIDYRAAAGETNRVLLVQVDERTIRVSDPGALITPGRGCRSVDAQTVECSTAQIDARLGLISSKVHVGDMNDVVDSQGPGLSADGGPGDDTLQSSSGAAGTLDGGGGRDRLLGGRNIDTLIDGDSSGSGDSDILDGREGGAVVSYAARTAPVKVNLADPGPDGERGEGDIIRAVDRVIGGAGADTLLGDNNSNNLDGGPGPDRLDGLTGQDFLHGGRGADRMDGHAGPDSLDGAAGADSVIGGDGGDTLDGGRGPDRLDGGPGPDRLWAGSAYCRAGRDLVAPSASDYVHRDCEQARFLLPTRAADAKWVELEPYPYRQAGSSLTFRVRCPYNETDGYPDPVVLTGVVRITGPDRRLLGAGRVPSAGRRCMFESEIESPLELPRVQIRAKLNEAGSRLLSRPRGGLVTVAFSGRNVPPVPWRIRLKSGP